MPTLELPASLRALAGNRATLTVEARTVGEALTAAVAQAPALRDALFTEAGGLKRTVNVFVGDDDLRELQGLQTALGPKAVVTLVTALAGG
jgi:adenylyltransferase/sulfurtransferase